MIVMKMLLFVSDCRAAWRAGREEYGYKKEEGAAEWRVHFLLARITRFHGLMSI